MSRPTLVRASRRPPARARRPLLLLVLLAPVLGACASLRPASACARGEFLYTERLQGRGQTVRERPVYRCLAGADTARAADTGAIAVR